MPKRLHFAFFLTKPLYRFMLASAIIFYCLSGFGVSLQGQVSDDQYIDSMELEIQKIKDPYKKARKMLLLSNHWSFRDTVKAFEQIKKAEKYFGNDKSLKGLALIYKAGIIYDTDIEKSQKMYMEAEEMLKDIDKPLVYDDRAILWHNYAALEQNKGNDREFVKIIIEKCIPLVQKSKNKNLLASYYSDLGMALNNIGDFKKSESYFKSSLAILNEGEEDKHDVKIWTLINMANMYTKHNELEKAKEIFDESEKVLNNYPNSQYGTLYYLFLTQYLYKKGQDGMALIAVEKGIQVAEELNIPYDVESLNFEKYKILKRSKNYSAALIVISKILETNMLDNPQNRINYLEEMAWIQNELGNYKEAYKYQLLFREEKDSLNELESGKNIRELEAKFNTSLKEQELERLENKSKLQRTIFFAALILILSLLGFLIYALYQRKRRNQNEILMMQKNKDLDVARAVNEGSILERKRIANEIHDGISGRITGVKMALENASDANQDQAIEKSASQLGNVLDELRGIVRNLMPETLLESGLERVLTDFCHSMQSENRTIQFYSSHLEAIRDTNYQLNIYRIIQELVTNSIRHGNATEILVQAVYENSLLLIDVEDNGKGFDFETVNRNFGINSVQQRVKILGGEVNWESKSGEGTKVSIECSL